MVRVVETTRIGRVTGPGSASRTPERFGIHGTDLGILWDGGDGRVRVLFGDTYGEGWHGHGAGPADADWRRNVLTFSANRDLEHGLVLDDAVCREDGVARQVIPSGRREVTVIPNGGIAVDGRHYVHYMSVRRWGPPGRWRTGHAGIAVSADGGRTFTKPPAARWPNRWRGGNRFQIGAFARSGEHVYLFGTTNGRYGDAYLARARPEDLLDTRGYRYWTGSGWSRRQRAAAAVFAGPVGEMSVGYSSYLGRWLLLHLDEPRKGIVLRSAERLTGPWSWGEVVVSGREYPAVYGGFLHPWSLDGPDLYYLVSQWGPYNVFLQRTRVAAA